MRADETHINKSNRKLYYNNEPDKHRNEIPNNKILFHKIECVTCVKTTRQTHYAWCAIAYSPEIQTSNNVIIIKYSTCPFF